MISQRVFPAIKNVKHGYLPDFTEQGGLYEYMLGKLSTAGQNGQFCTPRHIIKMMVELLQPTPEDTICDANRADLIQSHQRGSCRKVG